MNLKITHRHAVALATLGLIACGGGGDDAQPLANAAGGGAAAGSRVTLAAAPLLPLGTPAAPGAALRCGNLSLGASRAGEIEVPPGEVCVLLGTRVDGNIQLGAGSVLDARDVAVLGNVQGERTASVLLAGTSSVAGSVQLKLGGSASIVDAQIGGDLQFEEQRGPLLAQGNRIGGNLQAKQNLGGLRLDDNLIDGNLQCQGNQPAPAGSGNRATSVEDQCAAMGAGTPADPGLPINPPVAPLPPAGGATLPPAVFGTGSDVLCRDVALGAGTYANVEVPAGARCELIGTVLTGNLQAQGAGAVTVNGAQILGSVQFVGGGALTLNGSRIGGSVQLERQAGLLWLQGLQVGGDIQLFDNRGGATLADNRAGGNLQCQGNQPAPAGSGNAAASREDQCRGL